LECTKSYECVVLFGAATDSYDAVGKVVSKAPYEHVTKDMVEKALSNFKGTIMQKPSIFSALKVNGKKMYEYARAGGEIPEVKAREVSVESLEMLEWLEPGSHEFSWPEEEVEPEEMKGAETLIKATAGQQVAPIAEDEPRRKRSRTEDDDGPDATILVSESAPKKLRLDEDTAMSGGLPVEGSDGGKQEEKQAKKEEAKQLATPEPPAETPAIPVEPTTKPIPPAARLRMTVTSGFYVRSLCHDLGLAVGSLGLMSSLVRTRQGAYELGKNVVEYGDLAKGEEVWGPKVQQQLETSMEEEQWMPEAVTVDEQEYQEILRTFEYKKRVEANGGGWDTTGRDNKGRGGRGGRKYGGGGRGRGRA
jgi:tRNA pseudouridine55 synthase